MMKMKYAVDLTWVRHRDYYDQFPHVRMTFHNERKSVCYIKCIIIIIIIIIIIHFKMWVIKPAETPNPATWHKS